MNWILKGNQDYAGCNKWDKAQAGVEVEMSGNESIPLVPQSIQPKEGELVKAETALLHHF